MVRIGRQGCTLVFIFIFLISGLLSGEVSGLDFTVNSPTNDSVYHSAKLVLDVDTDVDSRVWFNLDGGANYSINSSVVNRDDDGETDGQENLYAGRALSKNLTSSFNLSDATSAKVFFNVGHVSKDGAAGATKPYANITVSVNGHSGVVFDTKDVVNDYHWESVEIPAAYLNDYNNTIVLETTESGGGNYYKIALDTDTDFNRSWKGPPPNPATDILGELMIYVEAYFPTNNRTADGIYYFPFDDEGWHAINIYADDGETINHTSLTIDFKQNQELLILGNNLTHYNLPLIQFFNLYGIPVHVSDKNDDIDIIYEYENIIEDERVSLENTSEDQIIFDWVSRGGKYFSISDLYFAKLALHHVFGSDGAYLAYSPLNNTVVTNSSTHLTDNWDTINQYLSGVGGATNVRHFNTSTPDLPTEVYVNWTNGTFTAPFYFKQDYGNGSLYLALLNTDYSRIGHVVSRIFSNEPNWRLLFFDDLLREWGYTAKLQAAPMKELRIDDPLENDTTYCSAALWGPDNHTNMVNALISTGSQADLYIVASRIYADDQNYAGGPRSIEYRDALANHSEVLNYGIHGWVHKDFGNSTDEISIADAEANFTAAINNITGFYGSCSRIWVPPGHEFNLNATIAASNLNITYMSTSQGSNIEPPFDSFSLASDSFNLFFNYSSGVYNLPSHFDFNGQVDWNSTSELTHQINDKIGQPMVYYTHGTRFCLAYNFWADYLLGSERRPYWRWVSLDDVGNVMKAQNEKTINEYVVNDTTAEINFTLNMDVFGIDFVIYVPEGKYVRAYLDGEAVRAYYVDEFNRTRIMLPRLSNGTHIVRAEFNTTSPTEPYLKYCPVQIDNLTYDPTNKEFNISVSGTGVNKSMTIIYNATDSFLAKDNKYVFATVSGGVVSGSDSNYGVSYDGTSGVFNFTIPSMSDHEIILQEYTPAAAQVGTGGDTGHSSPSYVAPSLSELSEEAAKAVTGKAYELTNVQRGQTQAMSSGDGALFTGIDGKTHVAVVKGVDWDKVTLDIYSQPVRVVLGKGETKHLDLNKNGRDDFVVIVKSIDAAEGKAEIYFKVLMYEPVPTGEVVKPELPAVEDTNPDEEERPPAGIPPVKAKKKWPWVLAGLAIACVISYFIFNTKR